MMFNKLGDRGLGQFVLVLHCKHEVCFTKLCKKHFRLYAKVIFYTGQNYSSSVNFAQQFTL
jgi:hypothetical protein